MDRADARTRRRRRPDLTRWHSAEHDGERAQCVPPQARTTPGSRSAAAITTAVQTFWQLAVSIVPVGAIVLIEAPGGPVHWSPELVAILAYNCIVTTALGYFLWGKVLSMMPAATAGQVLMLTPIGGFVLSTLIFGGAVTAD